MFKRFGFHMRQGLVGLRGGHAAENPLVRSVACSLLANSLAIATHAVLVNGASSSSHHPPRRRPAQLARSFAYAFAIGILCYLLTYLLTGFVPMGYVHGSLPVFSTLSKLPDMFELTTRGVTLN